MNIIHQSLGIAVAFILVLIWQYLGLTELTVPAIGLLAFSYLLLSRRAKKNEAKVESSKAVRKFSQVDEITTAILTCLVLILINDTGGLHSPVFFLLYFIPFAICFVLVPEVAAVYLLGIVILFLPGALQKDLADNLIKLGSVGLITPLAYFFGKEYLLVSEHQEHDTKSANKISSEAANLLRDHEANLGESDKAQLADIIRESEGLKN